MKQLQVITVSNFNAVFILVERFYLEFLKKNSSNIHQVRTKNFQLVWQVADCILLFQHLKPESQVIQIQSNFNWTTFHLKIMQVFSRLAPKSLKLVCQVADCILAFWYLQPGIDFIQILNITKKNSSSDIYQIIFHFSSCSNQLCSNVYTPQYIYVNKVPLIFPGIKNKLTFHTIILTTQQQSRCICMHAYNIYACKQTMTTYIHITCIQSHYYASLLAQIRQYSLQHAHNAFFRFAMLRYKRT
eukprot:TRINITY_DN11860_c0_g1_i2.p1 TRINITY_DN11860_c0_g1~~TRINITY_DN11860_c0_g1_i2.p1  ORF type:complete len:264 (+),score=-14.19 TRINITY_DN11860_c0_g1_i2:62-793(+)